MKNEPENAEWLASGATGTPGMPVPADRATFQAEPDALRLREKAHPREGNAIAAARRRLPMVEVDPATPLSGKHGPVSPPGTFGGRRQLIAYYLMQDSGQPAAARCEGCTFYTSQVRELSYLHSCDVTYATFCQGPCDESIRYRDFMGWDMPWYSAQGSLGTLLADRRADMFHLVCYLRHDDQVSEAYWTTGRGVEVMDNSYALLDMTAYERQESWGDSPADWPRRWDVNRELNRANGRPTAQRSRLQARHSGDLRTAMSERRH